MSAFRLPIFVGVALIAVTAYAGDLPEPVECGFDTAAKKLTPLAELPPGERDRALTLAAEGFVERGDGSRRNRWLQKVDVLTLTLFRTEGDPTAAVIICPGGGYSGLSFDKEGAFIAEWLRRRGVVAGVLKYPVNSGPEKQPITDGPLNTLLLAIDIMKQEFSIPVGVMGFSAGGHLAAMGATSHRVDFRPDFHALVYPVISMSEGVTHPGSRKNLLGERPTEHEIARFSADERVTKTTPPAFLVHTADDRVTPLENSLRYAQACADHGVPVELHVYERGGHGYGMWSKSKRLSTWPEAFERWLIARGYIR